MIEKFETDNQEFNLDNEAKVYEHGIVIHRRTNENIKDNAT